MVQSLYSVEEWAVTLTEQFIFPPFRLDPVNEQLWRESQRVPLRPKAFAVLRFLVEHAGQLVTKEELLKGVWPKTRVSEGILKGYIRDLRDILGDDAQQSRFIETVPRRGHRFIAAVSTAAPVQSSQFQVPNSPLPFTLTETREDTSPLRPGTWNLEPGTLVVGRDAELTRLHSLFAKALNGERQIVFVTGEPGIGKTTLVEAFLHSLEAKVQVQDRVVSSQQSVVRREEERHKAKGTKQKVQNHFPTPNTRHQTPNIFAPRPLILDPWIGRGQCIEQHGAGEAYLPLLEAVGRIGRGPDGEVFIATLHQYAPTWLVQMPALVGAVELEALQRRVLGTTRERMLREMVEAIEALTAQRPLVLWLEDLHWADASTVDWLAAIAQCGAPARLLVIGTYRPSDLSLSGHPLSAVKQELVAKGQCEELWLPFLSAEEVRSYLRRRYPEHQFPFGLGAAIHQRTDGNPLFVVNTVEYLAAQGVIAEVGGHWRLQTAVDEVGRGLPENLRQLIEKHIERLSEDRQRLLEVASVVGVTFSTAAVAAGIEAPVEQVEEWCEGLVQRGQFLQAQEPRTLPDGTLCGSYGFLHALQHAVVYGRIPNLRQLRLHRRVGDSEERLYGARAHEIAAELAVHFERGGDLHRAVQYRQHAGHNALRQHGYQEAITHLKRGLELLATFPDTPERGQQELALQIALGSPLQALQGYGAAEVEAVYTRARELSEQIGETAQLFPVLRGLYVFYLLRGKIQTAHALAERLLNLAQKVQDSAFLLEAHFALGQTRMFRGDFVAAREHFEQGIALYNPVRHHSHAFLYGQDPGVFCQVLAAWDLCFLGYPDQALKRNHEALAVAQEVIHPFSVAAAQTFFAVTHQFRREGAAALEHAEAAVELSAQQGFPFFLALSTIMRGWALAEQGQTEQGIVHIRQGLAAYRATGAELATTRFIALLAEALGQAGQPEEGLTVLAEALAIVNKGGERDYEAELYRLKGQLTLQKFQVSGSKSHRMGIAHQYVSSGEAETVGDTYPTQSGSSSQTPSVKPHLPKAVAQEAEGYLLKAIPTAQQQHAKSLELRAVMSLVRLRKQQTEEQSAQRKKQGGSRGLAEAHTMLSSLYGWFTEGFDTKDLQEAKALLEELSH